MPLRDTLLRASDAYLYRVHFSQEILDGATRNLVENKKMTQEKAARFQSTVLESFPEALVEVPESLVEIMTNHQNDRHVVAAAVVSQAKIIVTFNLKHFSTESLARWNITAQHPDDFLEDLCRTHGIKPLVQIIEQQAQDLKRPPMTILELLEKLYKQTPKFVSLVTTYLWGREAEFVAREYIKLMVSTSDSSYHFYEGKYYNFCLNKSIITVAAKDDRGNILVSNTKDIKGKLTPEDVKRFQKAKEVLAEVTKQTR